MSKKLILNASEVFISLWNDNSNDYMDWESAKEKITGVKAKDPHINETMDMLDARIKKLSVMSVALHTKWMETYGDGEAAAFSHYKMVERALKAARMKRQNIKYGLDASEKTLEDIQEYYTG